LAAASDKPGIYGPDSLVREQTRLMGRIRQLFNKAVQPNLNAEQLSGLAGVQFRFPLVGIYGSPLDFYSDGVQRHVYLPIASLRFVEDLATAYAWLWANRGSLEPIDEYVATLKYGRQSARHLRPPLEALGIPADALGNATVDDLSLRFRNGAFAYILAHELGHVLYAHRGYGPGMPRDRARHNEEEADRFALEIMRLTSTVPVGALLYFQASAYYQPNRGDFSSDTEWETFLDREATHPVTGSRLRTMARLLNEWAPDFVRLEQDRSEGIRRVHFIAGRIAAVAAILEDSELQKYIARKLR
jgi:hypothetical protein